MRDRVPERVHAAGGSVRTQRLDDTELRAALLAKLLEEVGEVADAIDRDALVEELADVLEVVHALAEHEGVADDEIRARAAAKRATHGAFEQRLWTSDYVAPPPSDDAAGRSRRRAAAASPRQRREQ